MPTRAEFSERRNLAKTEVVRRLWVGETLTGVCGDPHMPNRTTVVRWARRDETFADALAQAHRRSAWTRHEGFDEVRARIVQARFAAGETLFSICRDPAMPSCKQLAYWRATQGEFGGAIFRLIRAKKAARSSASPHNAPRDWTEAVGDRILLHVGRGHSVRRLRRLDPSLPGPDTIARWRLQNPEFAWELKVNMAVGRQRRVVPTRMAAVLDTLRRGIIKGGSIQSLAGTRGLPCRATLYSWARRSPDFARQVAQACDWREDWYTDQMQIIAEEAPELDVTAARRRMAPLSRQLARLGQRPGMKGR